MRCQRYVMIRIVARQGLRNCIPRELLSTFRPKVRQDGMGVLGHAVRPPPQFACAEEL